MIRKRKVKPLWSCGQIAELVGVDRKTVRRWMASGKIDSIKMPGDKGEQRVHTEVLREFLTRLGYTHIIRDMNGLIRSANANKNRELPGEKSRA